MRFPFRLIIQYAAKNHPEFRRATAEFNQNLQEPFKPDDELSALFGEWLIYDFQTDSGVNFINLYCQKNPDDLSAKELEVLKQVADTQFYSAFEIQKIKRGEYLELEDLSTGKHYRTYDVKGSRTAPEKGTLFTRIGRVEGHWHLVGANPAFFPIVHTPRFKRLSKQSGQFKGLSLLQTIPLWQQPPPNRPITQEKIAAKDLKIKRYALQVVYEEQAKRYKISLTFDELAKAIFEEDRTNVVDFWKKLTHHGLSEEFLFNNLPLLQDCWNHLPHRCLGGKCPSQVYIEHYKTAPPD